MLDALRKPPPGQNPAPSCRSSARMATGEIGPRRRRLSRRQRDDADSWPPSRRLSGACWRRRPPRPISVRPATPCSATCGRARLRGRALRGTASAASRRPAAAARCRCSRASSRRRGPAPRSMCRTHLGQPGSNPARQRAGDRHLSLLQRPAGGSPPTHDEPSSTVPAGDVVLLHGCCHNPSGTDLDHDQWRQLAAVLAGRGSRPSSTSPIWASATDLRKTRSPCGCWPAPCREMVVAVSCSKNFGIYRERTGAAFVLAARPRRPRSPGST